MWEKLDHERFGSMRIKQKVWSLSQRPFLQIKNLRSGEVPEKHIISYYHCLQKIRESDGKSKTLSVEEGIKYAMRGTVFGLYPIIKVFLSSWLFCSWYIFLLNPNLGDSRMTEILRSLPPMWKIWTKSLAWAWASPGYFSLYLRELANGCSPPLFLSNKMKTKR